MVPIGQKNVYPGHDLYVLPTISLLAGGAGLQAGSIVVMTDYEVLDGNNQPQGWQVDMLDSLRSYPDGFNPGEGWDGRIFRVGSGPHMNQELGWGGAQANWVTAAQMNGDKGAIRVRVPSHVTPANYTLVVTLQEFNDDGATMPVGAPISLNWPFRVYPPATFVATPPSSFPDIPGLLLWQARMQSAYTGGGEYWCTRTSSAVQVQSLEYGTFLGPAFSMVGNFDANSQPDASKQYNYDGGRVYLQIADYSFNTPGMVGYHDPFQRAHWEHCAQMVLYPYDNWLARSHGDYINEPNQHLFGTGMYYARHQGETAGQALSFVTDKTGRLPAFMVRWIRAICGLSVIPGIPKLPMKPAEPTDLGSFPGWPPTSRSPTWIYFSSSPSTRVAVRSRWWSITTSRLGLMLESLIAQCELDDEKLRGCDPRIPLEVGKTLHALFNNFYFSDIGTTRYNFLDIPMSHEWNDPNSTEVWANLNNLISPAAAWYWSLTSDTPSASMLTRCFSRPLRTLPT